MSSQRELPTDSRGKNYDDYRPELDDLNDRIKEAFAELEDLTEGKPLPYLGWWLGDGPSRISWYQGKYWLDPKGKWPYPSFYISWMEGGRTDFYRWLLDEIERLVEQGGVLHEDRVRFQRKLMELSEAHGPVTKREYLGDGEGRETDLGVPTPKIVEDADA